MLKGKSAVVTGSTSGIGLGIARALAVQGVNVMLNGLANGNDPGALCAQLASEHGVKTAFSRADMSRPAEIAAMFAEAELAFGAVDILVNNAGIQHVAPVDEFPLEKWDQIIAINLSSVFHAPRQRDRLRIHAIWPAGQDNGPGQPEWDTRGNDIPL